MLHKVLYSKTSDLYHTNFLSLQQGTLVVPGPEVADLWRQELNLSKISMETLTYADWIKELLSQSGSADRIQFSKSELWDVLHRVWKNSDAPENFNLFQKVFDLYTDLKSMTNDASIFKQVLSMETALQESTLVLLERVYALKEINDEYQNVRDIIAEVEERGLQWLEGKKIHLVGFKILSGLQIDLLQKLAQHAEIYVYVPKYLDAIIYERSLNDWPSWLKPEKTHHLESHSYSSSRHAYTIYPVSEMDSIWSMLRGKTVYILTSKNDLSQCHWGQSRIAYSMKSTSNVGISGSSSVMALIREELMVSSKTWHQLLQIIEKEYKSHLIKKNNYPKLKWLQYTKNWIDIKLEHIEKETEFSWLDFNVLKQKIELDAVRLHWQVYSEHEETIKIEQLQKGLFFYSSSEKIIVIDEPIQQKISEEKYTANSSKLLSSLSPTVSKEWHIWYIEFLLLDCLESSQKTLLVINKDVYQFDLFLRKIIEEKKITAEVIAAQKQIVTQEKKETISRVHIPVLLSPSALQKYKNCPRQYYTHYVLSLSVPEEYQAGITESKKGEILHDLIQKLSTDQPLMFKLLDDENLRKQFILESVSPMTLADDILSEIQEIMKHFLDYWTKFPIVNNHQKLFFEEEFQLPRLRMKGRIDFSCYDVKNESLLLLDFKKSTVPTYSEIEKYEQWQVLCYLAGWKSLHPEFTVKKIILGYLNLSSMKESPLVVNFNVDNNAFLAGMSSREIKNFDLWVKEFEDHWMGYVNDLTKEEKFLPFPRHVSVCEYCAVKNSCPKGVQE